MSTTTETITEYLSNGGLFNPEMMDHERVRDLLFRCREDISDHERWLREMCEDYKLPCDDNTQSRRVAINTLIHNMRSTIEAHADVAEKRAAKIRVLENLIESNGNVPIAGEAARRIIEIIVIREQVKALTKVVNELAQVMESDPNISGPWKKRVWNAVEKLQYAGEDKVQEFERMQKP